MEPGCVLVCTVLIIEISIPKKIYLDFILWVSSQHLKSKKKKKKVKAREENKSTALYDMCFHSYENLIFYINRTQSIRISFLIFMRSYT